MSDHFNALQYARQLEAAGVPENQAAVHANTLAQVLDNYAQINDIKREIAHAVSESETRLRAEIAASEARLEAKFTEKLAETESALRSEIAGAEARLRAEIVALEARFESRLQSVRAEMARLRLMNGIIIALLIAILAQGYFR